MSVFAVSKVRLDADGRITHVSWGEVNTADNDWVDGEAVSEVAEVVRAIRAGHDVFALFPADHGHVHERRFKVVEYDGGWATVGLDGGPSYEREVHDMARMEN